MSSHPPGQQEDTLSSTHPASKKLYSSLWIDILIAGSVASRGKWALGRGGGGFTGTGLGEGQAQRVSVGVDGSCGSLRGCQGGGGGGGGECKGESYEFMKAMSHLLPPERPRSAAAAAAAADKGREGDRTKCTMRERGGRGGRGREREKAERERERGRDSPPIMILGRERRRMEGEGREGGRGGKGGGLRGALTPPGPGAEPAICPLLAISTAAR